MAKKSGTRAPKKGGGVKLDVKDWKILYELDVNARQSLASIGKKVRLSKEVVNYRIKRLIMGGIIKGFNTIIDYSKLGYIGGRLYIKFQHDSPKIEKEIIGYFVKNPNVWWVNSRNGNFDLGIAFWSKDVYEFHSVQKEFARKYRRYFKEIAIGIYDKMYQFKRAYLANKERDETKPITIYSKEKARCDETDWGILMTVASDARMPTVDIAEKLRLTPAVVKYRLLKLERKNVIRGYRVIIDLGEIGYYWYKIEFWLEDYSKVDEMLAFAHAHPNIIYAYDALGGADFELELEVKGSEQFEDVLNELRSRFSGRIRYYNYYQWTKEHKLIYMPSG